MHEITKRHRYVTSVAVLAFCGLLTGVARGDVVLSQPPSAAGTAIASAWVFPDGSDLDMYAYDDFTLPAAAAITAVDWRGTHNVGSAISDFTVTFFDSIAGGSQPLLGNPQLEDTVHTYIVKYHVGGTANEIQIGLVNGVPVYDYSFVLPAPFQALAGTKYWIRIEAEQPGSPDWGIMTGTGGDGRHFAFSTGLAMFFFGSGDAAFTLRTAGTAPTATGTITPAATATGTGGPTATPTPAPTATATATGSSATVTATATAAATTTAAPPTATPTPTPTATATPGLDAFACYSASTSAGASAFAGRTGDSLVDPFGSSTVSVKKARHLCAPANVLDADPTAPAHAEHLESYAISPASKFAARTNLRVVDALNPTGLHVDVRKPALLLVPSAAAPSGPALPPATFGTDHFQCYAVLTTSHTPKFVPVPGVTVADGLGSMTVTVTKPQFLCAPTNVNGADPTAPQHASHLSCYQIKRTDGVKFAGHPNLFVGNAFGSEQLDAKKPQLLCMPATVTP